MTTVPTIAPLEKARASAPLLVAALLLSLGVAVVIGYLHFDHRVHAYQLLDDVTSWAGVKWYTGFLSHFVVLLWCASAAVCGFAGAVLRAGGNAYFRALGRFLVVMAIVNIWLTLDDLFLFHEQVARLFEARDMQHAAEGMVFASYATVLAVIFWRQRGVIAHTDYPLLGAAIVSLLASAAIDIAFQMEMDGKNAFREAVLSVSWGPTVSDISEDVLKLNGAVLWLCYFCKTGYSGVSRAGDSATDGAMPTGVNVVADRRGY